MVSFPANVAGFGPKRPETGTLAAESTFRGRSGLCSPFWRIWQPVLADGSSYAASGSQS